ncbi:class I SAM-dependent methyltransferase [Myxococcota bacterium]|nr:class I SAM-dependent methyltransferase [Myxococcota bacterium]
MDELDPDDLVMRASWDFATRAHNAHKGDQARFLRDGGDTLFPEELELLGDVRGRALVHLQCNAGQDTLCLARRGADVVGVDLSTEAITFARGLSRDSGITAEFEESEIHRWMEATPRRFDVAFASYGVFGWHRALDRWFRGVSRILVPGGRFVSVEIHPLAWSIDAELKIAKDDYFTDAPFREPVSDYVAESGAGLLHGADVPLPSKAPYENPHVASSYQHTTAALLQAVIDAGLVLRRIVEWPHVNGCKVSPALVADGRRWVWPAGAARVPLMLGFVAERPLARER